MGNFHIVRYLVVLFSVSIIFASSEVPLSLTNSGYQLKVRIPEYSLTEVSINEKNRAGENVTETFVDLDIPNYADNCEFGGPEILSQTFDIALESNSIEFNVEILDADTIALSAKLFPKQYELVYSHRYDKREVFAYDPDLYDDFKNEPTVQVAKRYTFRNQKAATIQITPVSYNPADKSIIIIKSMVIDIKTEKPKAVRSANSDLFDKVMRKKFQNLRSDAGSQVPRSAYAGDEDYLIIATSEYINNPDLKTLIDYRSSMFNVEVVDASTVGNSKDAYRSFIRGKMPTYCLLVGKHSSFPVHQFAFQFQQPTNIKSASYFVSSQTSGMPNPDIALGLFFVDNATQLKNIVTKTIKTEENIESFPNVYVGMGGNYDDMGPGLPAEHCDLVVKQMGKDFFVPKGYKHVELYSVLQPKGGKQQLISAVNAGARFVNYNGHGSVNGWMTGWYNNDIRALNNTEYFPFVLSCACLTGTFDQACIAKVFAYDDNGPAAWIGSYQLSSMGQHTLNYGVYEAIMKRDITKYGSAFVYGQNSSTMPSGIGFPSNDHTKRLMQLQYHFFGDPAVETIHAVDTDPNVKVVSPNGGEKWEQHGTYEIKWSSNVEENVDIKLFNGNSEVLTIASSEINDGSYNWRVPEDLAVGTNYKIEVACITTGSLQDMSDNNFSITAENLIADFPYVQSFDVWDTVMNRDFGDWVPTDKGFTDSWTQLGGDDLEWSVWTGPTPSKIHPQGGGTGPDAGQSGRGNYLLLEASSPNTPSKSANFITPKFSLKNLSNPQLSFWLHMFDNQGMMGTLAMDILVDGTWHKNVQTWSGDHGDKWFLVEQDLSRYKGDRVQLRFRGVTGSDWASDICIDDFEITGDKTAAIQSVATTEHLSMVMQGGRLNYSIPSHLSGSDLTIDLYNLSGRRLFSLKRNGVKSGVYVLDLSTGRALLASGLYIAKMNCGDRQIAKSIYLRR